MSHLISFPIMESPTEDSSSFDAFHSIQNQYSPYQVPPSPFDYYRLPSSNISDPLSMSLHGAAFKPQLLSHLISDLSSALPYSSPPRNHHQQQQQQQPQQQQQQPQQQQCIPTSQLFSNVPLQSAQVKSPSPSLDDNCEQHNWLVANASFF
jgi:hypothetical protein